MYQIGVSAMQKNKAGKGIWSSWVTGNFKQGDQGKPSRKVIFEQRSEGSESVCPELSVGNAFQDESMTSVMDLRCA